MVSLSKLTTPTMKPNPPLITHSQLPTGLHYLNPRSVLGAEWWNKERWEASQANNHCCYACGVHKSVAMFHQWVEGHEQYSFNFKTHEATYVVTVSLFHACHNFIHCGRLYGLLRDHEISARKYLRIIKHGIDVLATASM